MRRLSLVAVFAASALTQIAFAADLPVKAPQPAIAPPPAYSWTGLYVGGNVGYAWGSVKDDPVSVLQLGGAGGFATLTAPANSYDPKGVLGGVQIGYNWQIQNFLLGIETDIQASDQKGSDALNTIVFTNVIIFSNPATVTYNTKLDWFGTLRGRVGFTLDRWLAYFTGGLAYGRLDTNVSALAAPAAVGPNSPFIWNSSSTHTGWVIGGGVENALTSNWSWKLEYFYMDLGKVTTNLSTSGAGNCYGTPGICASFSAPAAGQPITAKFTDNIIRGGLNYKF